MENQKIKGLNKKEYFRLYQKEYRNNNRDQIKEYNKKYMAEYYKKNKSKYIKKEKVHCDICNKEVLNIYAHCQTKKHKNKIVEELINPKTT